MYPNNSSPGQWNPNATPTSQASPGWSPQPPNGQYAPRQDRMPPISQAVQPGPAMQTLQPQQHPEAYRALPPPQHMYAPPGYGHPQQMPYAPQQPAPRQRTAIACRYCRRRKIRCSGFDTSEDGRCTNCQRFSQECIFTPVSAQTQAFVPAHTVWRGQNPPQGAQLYGAYGQPLPQHGGRENYPPPQAQPGQYPPPPQGYQQPPMYGQPPPQQMQSPGSGQKRGTDEPHTPTLPPPNPGGQAQMGYGYPDPAGASFNSPDPSFQLAAQPFYYTDPYHPFEHAYAHSTYPYEVARAPYSPTKHAQPGAPVAPPTSSSLSPAGDAQRQGVKIAEIVGLAAPQAVAAAAQAIVKQEERTSTDTNQAGDGSLDQNPASKKKGIDVGVQTDESRPPNREQVS